MLFTVKFRLRSQNHNKSTNLTPLYCRLTVNGITCPDFFTGVRCNPIKWNHKEQRIIGSSNDILEDNKTLDNIRASLKSIINNLEEGEDVFAVRKKYLEKDLPKPTLVEAFEMFIKNEKECFKGTEKELNEKTIQKWYYSRDHIKSFTGDKFKLRDIKKGFERKYFVHLLQSGKMGNNHAIRNVSYLNSVLDYCVMERFMEENPISLKTFLRDQPKPIVYLSDEQVSVIENIQSVDPHFIECRDIFLFMCYTSLDNNEIQKMDIEQHLDGNCIKITRGKTKHKSLQIIPLLPKTRLLLKKYNNQIPIHPTYRINRYLDVIETVLKLNFNLSTKVGRKTAGMFFLTNRVPIEVVSRILGHKSVVTTQKHYADVLSKVLIINSTKHLM